MPNKHYLRGRRFEWALKKELEDEGWLVLRTAGSHGPFDLVAIDPSVTPDVWKHPVMILIQCKTVSTAKDIKKLEKAFENNLPLNTTVYSQHLYIKIKGQKDYHIYYARGN